MINIKTPLPRLLDSSNNFVRELHPSKVSVTLNITPLSTVSMQATLQETVPIRSYVEFFTPLGSAGIYRLRSPAYEYGEAESTLEFEHAITEVGDYLIKAKIEKDSEDSDPYYAYEAMTEVFGHYGGSKWQLGSLSVLTPPSGASSSEKKKFEVVVSETYSTVLNAMLNILDQMPRVMMTFNFSTTPWTIGFALRDDTVSAEGRLSRNIDSATVTYDDSELCTRLFMQGLPKSSSDTDDDHYGYLEAETLATYGVIEKSISGSDDYTEDQAMKMAVLYLENHRNPKLSVSINAEDLSLITGEAWDTFTIGKLMRLVVDDRTVEQNITQLEWDDVYNSPEDITVNLAEEEDASISYLTDDSSSSSSSGGSGSSNGGGAKKNKYHVQIPDLSQETEWLVDKIVYATSEQGALNKACPVTYSGSAYVNGIMHYVHNRTIEKDPDEDE